RNLTVGIWADQATQEAAERVLRISRMMAGQHSTGHSNVVFVLDGAPAPTPEANEVFAKIYDDKISDLACMAIVIEGGGFWASGIRSTITSLRMSTPGPMIVRVADKLEQVLEWLPAEHSQRTGVQVTPSELKAFLTATRALAANDNGEVPLSRRPRRSGAP
ncbi:MAG TPA: hypothetical protein VJR89_11190, partial [Polyangiales bacterium]|nr:hypothetical protein [Polyangiales bacterium]